MKALFIIIRKKWFRMAKKEKQKKEEEQTMGLTITKEEDFSEWYNQIVLKAKLADYSPIRGFMVIRPNGYAIWEKIQNYFNKIIEKQE